ncbi:MAG: 6-phosphogluconolactonase [Pseudomonadota bacterium]
MKEKLFDDREAMTNSLFNDLSEIIEQACREKDRLSIMLSGGSTPRPLYQKLSQANLCWNKIQLGLVDERWVETSHPASNAGFINSSLLQNKAAETSFQTMKNNAATAVEGLAVCNREYAKLPCPFDICLLGMGPDGHTASLFPGAKGLEEALNTDSLCAAITAQQSEVTGDFVERMTLTRSAILNSRKLILLMSGNDKWSVYQKAKAKPATKQLPISFFIQQNQVPMDVYWSP